MMMHSQGPRPSEPPPRCPGSPIASRDRMWPRLESPKPLWPRTMERGERGMPEVALEAEVFILAAHSDPGMP